MKGAVGPVNGVLGMKAGGQDRPVRSCILSCTLKRRRSGHGACPHQHERGPPWSGIGRTHSQFSSVSPNIPAMFRQISVSNPDLRTKSRNNYHSCHKESDVMSTSSWCHGSATACRKKGQQCAFHSVWKHEDRLGILAEAARGTEVYISKIESSAWILVVMDTGR